ARVRGESEGCRAFGGAKGARQTSATNASQNSVMALVIFPLILRYAVDWRRPRRPLRRVLFLLLEGFLDPPLGLRIAPLWRLGRRIFFLDVRRPARVCARPFPLEVVERQGRRSDAAAVNRRGNDESADQPAPGPRPHERPDLPQSEIIWKRVSTRAGRLVDDHHFGTVDSGDR